MGESGSCRSSCNTKKGDRLLEQTNMKLSCQPGAPINKMVFDLNHTKVDEWKEYNYS